MKYVNHLSCTSGAIRVLSGHLFVVRPNDDDGLNSANDEHIKVAALFKSLYSNAVMVCNIILRPLLTYTLIRFM